MNKEIVLLLTSTVNVQPHKCFLYQKNKEKRVKSYLKSISQWLQKTNFNIVLVENSGYKFEELKDFFSQYRHRFEFISFCETNIEEAKFLENNNSKGASEIFSINYAFKNSTLLKDAGFIVKITGRYFIPDFENYLAGFTDILNYDVLTQYDVDSCEIVGCNKKHFDHIFNNDLLDENGQYMGHVEYVYKHKCSLYKNAIRCIPFPIEPTCKGGTPQIHHYL